MPASSRLPPGWTSLGAKLFGTFMSLVLIGLGSVGLWFVHGDLRSGRSMAHHGAILRAEEPIAFAVQLGVAGTAGVVVLAIGVWMAWSTAFPPAEIRAARLRRRRARR